MSRMTFEILPDDECVIYDSLSAGDCFEYQAGYYMVTDSGFFMMKDSDVEEPPPMALNLMTGELMEFFPAQRVVSVTTHCTVTTGRGKP